MPKDLIARSSVVVSAAEIDAAISRVAAGITERLGQSKPVVVTIMQGGLFFAGQLLPRLAFPLELDYVHATRYGARTRGGELEWIAGPHRDVAGRSMLLVDDILDQGRTLAAIRDEFLRRGATEVLIAALAVKQLPEPAAVQADFEGVRVPDAFVFGCGMDVAGLWRNLPEIRVAHPGATEA